MNRRKTEEKAISEPSRAADAAPGDVSEFLRAWSDGDQRALDRLTPIVYDELRRLARPLHETRASRPQPADDGAGQ